ncbi:ESPR-type extended signal peptide-containing protein, partial [Megasphaera elsdenii]
MNKIFKVIYSKTRHCYVVVSELAKSHVKSSHGNGGQQKAALTMSVLLALGAFTFAFGPVNAEAANEKHYTEGQQYIGVYHTSDEESKEKAENYQGGLDSANQGAKGVGAISIGVHAEAGAGTITIGNRLAPLAQDSVFIGSKYDAQSNVYKTSSSKVVSIGADSNASGTGSVALGYGAAADVSNVSGDGKNPDKESQSIAIGYMATAKQNNIAIGANSVATDAASKKTAKFRDNTDSDYNAPSSYVSVGSSTLKRRITNVAAGADENDVATVGQLKKVADNKIAWKLTTAGDSNNASTVSAGDTVDFSAAKDSKENGQATGNDHSNLTISKENGTNGTNNKVNMTVGLSNNVVLGQNVSGEGGSLDVYRAVGDASSDTEKNENNQSYDQLGSHVRIDGSTVSVHYDNGTDSDARGAVLGIANDSYSYKDTDNKDTNDATKTVSSPLGYIYLQDGKNYYYLHGAMHRDTKYQGRLAYDSSESGYNYIANLDDGLKFTGDTENTTVETKLDPNAANNTLSITGGVTDSGKLTSGNIGVVATANTTDENGNVTSSGGLSIQLAKNLTGITSISSQTTSATTGAKIELGTNGTTISGGDVNVSKNKITGLANGSNDTDAATVGQMNTAIGNAKTKYYSVNDKNSISRTPKTLPTVTGLAENSDNLGAKGMGSLASGFSTEADGILSTVGGSYSGVINEGSVPYLLGVDIRGTAAVSYGTGNTNKSTAQSGTTSGVANSLIGQVNDVTDSNAAIAIGAGNTISNSYRDVTIDPIKVYINRHDPEALRKLMKDAVKESGGQVMVMGGGNNVESAYMSQVVGVGNTVKGNQVENDTNEWVTDTSSETAITDYDPEKSSQYNYVDGFSNEVINGKHDYVIGANNKLSGDSYDDNTVLPIKRSNKSNIVIGDNHILTREQNTVIIGSIDTKDKQTKANDAVIIGHNANATSDTGADNAVAIGLSATAGGGNAVTIGVNTSAGENSITIGSESSAIFGSNIAIGRYARVYGTKVTKAVALGQKAEAHVADGVAIGSGSIATVAGNSVEGYDPTTGQDSTDGTATWKATNAAVSIGTADGKVTRQINGVAAGTNDTDAVNVAQLKKLEGMKANVDASNVGSNIKVYKTGDDKTPVLDDEA